MRRASDWRRHFSSIALVGAIAALLWWCGDTFFSALGRDRHPKIFVYGFSILAEPLRERILPAFRDRWRREHGEEVEFVESFAASGTVANQIVYGAPCDIAFLAHPDDADRIAAAGMTRRPWRDLPYNGILNSTAIVILVRPGNPHGIASFADLARPGIRIVHPDPLTSGGAQWAILAEYGARLLDSRERAAPEQARREAYDQLLAIWRNVVAQAPSARAAKMQFDTGFGDALVTYEVEAFLDIAKGRPIELVTPASTILTEHAVVLVDHNIGPHERAAVEGLARFLWTEEAQRAFAEYGYRSVIPGLGAEDTRLRPIPRGFTVGALGGWRAARRAIVEEIWREHILHEVAR
jgi:sulfate transport system substrate-binding protein